MGRALVRSPLPERPQIHLISLPLGWERGTSLLPHLSSAVMASRTLQLRQLVRRFPSCAGTVGKCEPNTAQAIVDTALDAEADLIVVGAQRAPSRLERLLGGGVAERVAEQAAYSVLLTPIHQEASQDQQYPT